MLLIVMLVLMLILVCCYLGYHLRRGQGGNGARGGVTCTSWDTHISSQPIGVAISSPRRQTDVAQCWYRKVTGASTNFVAHTGLLLLGCKRQMCQVQEDGRLYPHRLGHIEHQQKVYHMSDVTDLLHQCIPEWDDSCKTGGMYQRSNIGALHLGTQTGVQEAPLGYQRHSFWFCYLVAICGGDVRGRGRMGDVRGGGTPVWEGHVVARRVWGTSGTRIYHMGHP